MFAISQRSSCGRRRMTEAVRAGADGLVHEAALYDRDWVPSGGDPNRDRRLARASDARQPLRGRFCCRQHPFATLTVVGSAGHFSTLIDNATTNLTELAAATPRDPV